MEWNFTCCVRVDETKSAGSLSNFTLSVQIFAETKEMFARGVPLLRGLGTRVACATQQRAQSTVAAKTSLFNSNDSVFQHKWLAKVSVLVLSLPIPAHPILRLTQFSVQPVFRFPPRRQCTLKC